MRRRHWASPPTPLAPAEPAGHPWYLTVKIYVNRWPKTISGFVTCAILYSIAVQPSMDMFAPSKWILVQVRFAPDGTSHQHSAQMHWVCHKPSILQMQPQVKNSLARISLRLKSSCETNTNVKVKYNCNQCKHCSYPDQFLSINTSVLWNGATLAELATSVRLPWFWLALLDDNPW